MFFQSSVADEKRFLQSANSSQSSRWNTSGQGLRLEKEWTDLANSRSLKRNSEVRLFAICYFNVHAIFFFLKCIHKGLSLILLLGKSVNLSQHLLNDFRICVKSVAFPDKTLWNSFHSIELNSTL